MLNAGHRKGATAGRCVTRGNEISTEELDAYAAVAMAGLGNLPDTIRTRSIIVAMRRRSGTEKVEPWRARVNEPEAAALAERLARWSAAAPSDMDWPVMPDQVQDRDADVWEALLAVADMAGGRWPDRARAAAVTLVTRSSNDGESLGVTLLRDLRDLFEDEDRLSTQTILDSLIARVESPWGDLRGKQLTDRQLAQLLKRYGVSPKQMRIEGASLRGYDKADLADPFDRYLQPLPAQRHPPSSSRLPGSRTALQPLQPLHLLHLLHLLRPLQPAPPRLTLSAMTRARATRTTMTKCLTSVSDRLRAHPTRRTDPVPQH